MALIEIENGRYLKKYVDGDDDDDDEENAIVPNSSLLGALIFFSIFPINWMARQKESRRLTSRARQVSDGLRMLISHSDPYSPFLYRRPVSH